MYNLLEQLRYLSEKIIADAFFLCFVIIVMLVILSAIFLWLEYKGKENLEYLWSRLYE